MSFKQNRSIVFSEQHVDNELHAEKIEVGRLAIILYSIFFILLSSSNKQNSRSAADLMKYMEGMS